MAIADKAPIVANMSERATPDAVDASEIIFFLLVGWKEVETCNFCSWKSIRHFFPSRYFDWNLSSSPNQLHCCVQDG